MTRENIKKLTEIKRNDIWQVIFSYLDIETILFSIPKVSKQLKKIFWFNFPHIKILYLTKPQQQSLVKYFSNLIQPSSTRNFLIPCLNLEKLIIKSNLKINFENLISMNSLIELSVSSEVSLILSVLKQNYQNLSTFKIINQTCPCQINLTDALISFINRHNIRKLRISSENLQKAQFFHFLANNDHIKDLKLEFYSNNYSETNTIDQTPDSDFYCKEFRSLSLEIEPTTANYCIKLLNSCTKLEKLKLKIPKFCPLSKISNILFQNLWFTYFLIF